MFSICFIFQTCPRVCVSFRGFCARITPQNVFVLYWRLEPFCHQGTAVALVDEQYVLLTTQSVREARQPFPLYDNIEWKRQIGNRALAFVKPRSEMGSLCYYEGGGVE